MLSCDQCDEVPSEKTKWWWQCNCEHTIAYIMDGEDAGQITANRSYHFAAAPHAPRYSKDQWLGWVTVQVGMPQRGGALPVSIHYAPENYTEIKAELGYIMPDEGRLQIIGSLMSLIQSRLLPEEFPSDTSDHDIKTPCPVASHSIQQSRKVAKHCEDLEGKMSNLFCIAMEHCCIPCYQLANGFGVAAVPPDANMGITPTSVQGALQSRRRTTANRVVPGDLVGLNVAGKVVPALDSQTAIGTAVAVTGDGLITVQTAPEERRTFTLAQLRQALHG